MKYEILLKEKGLSTDSIPEEIKSDIAELNELADELSELEAIEEKDEEDISNIAEIKQDIEEIDSDICESINKAFPVKPVEQPQENTEKKSKGLGWFLGFAALGILTAGAYWMYSKDKED